MKKLFSILAAVLFAGSMMADVVTFTKDDFAGQGTANTGSEVTATKGGVTFTYSKGYCADESLRCYAHGALTITATATIEKINFTTTGGKTGGLDAEVIVNATSYEVADLASQARFTEIAVTLGEGGEIVPPTPEPTVNYYVAGSMNGWGPDEAYRLTPSNNGEYEGEFTFAENDEFKVIGYDGTTVTWFPEGMGNNFQITEDGDYKITFNPAGNVEGWYAGFFNVVKKEDPIVPPVVGNEIIFTREDFLGQGTANTGSEVSATKGGVTFTYSKGYCADESLRCYAHGELSITASATIEKINFTTTGGKTGGLDAEVTVNATSYVVEDLASQARFTEVKVVLAGGTTVIDNNEVEMKAVKRVVNGQLFIEKNGVLYNAQGAVVR